MQALLEMLLKQLTTDPARAITLLTGLLEMLGDAAVPLLVGMLPAGPLRSYLEAHPAEVLAFLHDVLALVAKHPTTVAEIVKAVKQP